MAVSFGFRSLPLCKLALASDLSVRTSDLGEALQDLCAEKRWLEHIITARRAN
jgi:hypothetical protein